MGGCISSTNKKHNEMIDTNKTMVNTFHSVDYTNKTKVDTFHSIDQLKSHVDRFKHSSKLMVVYITGSWCQPKKFTEPVLRKLSRRHTNVSVIKFDVGEQKELLREIGVKEIPTIMLIRKGKVVKKMGANKDELQRLINVHR